MRIAAASFAGLMTVLAGSAMAEQQSDAVALLDLCISGVDIADIAAQANGFDILATETMERDRALLQPIGIVSTLGSTAMMVELGVQLRTKDQAEFRARFDQAGLTEDRSWTSTAARWGDGRFVILGGEDQFATVFETIGNAPRIVCAVMRTKPFRDLALPTGAMLDGSIETPEGTASRYRSENSAAIIAVVAPAPYLNELYSHSPETHLETYVLTAVPKR